MHFDKIIVGYFCPLIIVGYFSLAKAFVIKLVGVSSGLYSSLIPGFSQLKTIRNEEEIIKKHRYAFKYISLFSCAAVIIIFSLSKELVLLWGGESYLAAVRLIQVMVFILLLRPLAQIFLPIYYTYEKTKLLMFIQFIQTFGELSLYFVVIPILGVMGAVFTKIFIYVIVLLLLIYFSSKFFKSNISYYLKETFRFIGLAVISTLTILLINKLIKLPILVFGILKMIFIPVVLFTIYYLLKIFTREDLAKIAGIDMEVAFLNRLKSLFVKMFSILFKTIEKVKITRER